MAETKREYAQSVRSRSRTRLGFLAVFLCGVFGSSVAWSVDAASLRFVDGPRVLEELPDEIYTPRLMEGEYASEVWDYTFRFPKTGHVLFAQFMITNLGPGDHRGGALGWIVSPDGETSLVKNSRKRAEWELRTTDPGLHMYVASHELHVAPPSHRVYIRHGKRGTFEIDAETTTKPFRLGRIDYGDDRFYDMTVLAPRLRAKGRLTMPGQMPVDLGEGVGVAVHSKTNVAERIRLLSSLQFDTFDGDTQVSMFELTASKDFDYQRLAAILLIRDGAIEHHSSYDRVFERLKTESEKPEYRVPGAFTVAAKSDDWRVSGGVDLTLLRRDDILEFVNSGIARFFAKIKLKSRPIGYRFGGAYDLEMAIGDAEPRRIKGNGVATLTIVKEQPSTW